MKYYSNHIYKNNHNDIRDGQLVKALYISFLSEHFTVIMFRSFFKNNLASRLHDITKHILYDDHNIQKKHYKIY